MALRNIMVGNAAGNLDWHWIQYYGINAIGLGTGVTAIALMGFWRSQGIVWSWQPGHVILLCIGFHELVTLVAVGVDVATIDSSLVYDPFRSKIYETQGLVQHVGTVLLILTFLWHVHFSRPWRLIFGLLLFVNMSTLVMLNPFRLPMGKVISYDLIGKSSQTARVCVVVLVILLAVWDLIRQEPRDWLHWVGVALLLLHYSPWVTYSLGF
ncbi:hypothetical protein HOV93_14400 [Planctomycetes bacterium FF15]|uniref:Uncharacterized protein n=1 Tax=Bremerella alba TaxID=980252 RepID=A0A7V8V3K3_9BACT|nr:hypothetical protein [Bremerella alba]